MTLFLRQFHYFKRCHFCGMEKIWQWLTDRKAYCSLLESFWMRSASLLLKLNGAMWLLPRVACVSLQPGKVVEMTGKHGAVITWHNNVQHNTQLVTLPTEHSASQITATPFSSNFHLSNLPSLGAKQHLMIWTHFNILSHEQFVFLQQWELLFPTVLLLQLETCINLLAKYLYVSDMLLPSRHTDPPCSAFLVLRQILLTTFFPFKKI